MIQYYGNKKMILQASVANSDSGVAGELSNWMLGDLIVASGHKQLLIGDDNYEATVPRKRVVNVTGDYYFRKIDDVIVANAAGGAISVYLPSGATGLCATVIKSDGSANAVNILVSGSGQLIGGGYSVSLLTSGDFVEVVNGGNPYYSTSRFVNTGLFYPVSNPSGFGIVAGLTEGAVVFSSNSFLSGNADKLFWDKSNNALIINAGTGYNGVKLLVAGGQNGEFTGVGLQGSALFKQDASDRHRIFVQNIGSANYSSAIHFLGYDGYALSDVSAWEVGTDYFQNKGQTFYLWDSVSGALRLLVDPSGNVGVGNDSPSEKLDVSGNVRADNFYVYDGTPVSLSGHVHDYYSITNPNQYASSGNLTGASGALQSQINGINTWTGNSTGIYYSANNPSGFITGAQDAVEFSTKSGAYNLPFLTGQFVFDTGNSVLYLLANDGNRYFSPFNFMAIEGSGADIGPPWLENNRLGYGLGYVTDKTLSNIKIGGGAVTGDGAFRFYNGAFQGWMNDAWSTIVAGFDFREDPTGNYELEHKPVGFDTWLNVREGTSNEVGIDGLPVVRGYRANIGPYGVDLVIDGGDGR